jgi:hypothetical protein
MPKKNGAGKCKACCCKPITERVDEFDSMWACWKGNVAGLSSGRLDGGSESVYYPKHSGWVIDSGQLVFSKLETTSLATDYFLRADAVKLPYPFSMEIVIEVAELNVVNSVQANLLTRMGRGAIRPGFPEAPTLGRLSIGPTGTFGAFLTMPGASNSTSFNHTLATFKVQYRTQWDTDGMTHWVWVNDVLPTVTSGLAWGTKWSTTMHPLGVFKQTWGIDVQPATNLIMNDWAKFDRIEVREWDHTVVTVPFP